MVNVFLLLGSNLGDRFQYLQQAIAGIEKIGTIIKQSAIYETQAWGKTTEPDYLNKVIVISTDLQPRTILENIWDIEREMGRTRTEKWGSRTIDIDILFYGNQIISETGLIVPHPELHRRKFTLAPLSEIAPGLKHPILKKTMLELKNELKDCLIVKKL